MGWNRFRTVLLTAFALVGCDAGLSQLKPGVATATDVRRALGEPAFEWRDPDGGYTWEFPRGPTGMVTYMVDMAPDHKLKAIRQVLTDDYFAKIERGMPREAVDLAVRDRVERRLVLPRPLRRRRHREAHQPEQVRAESVTPRRGG